MSKLSTLLVAVRKISSPVSRSEFSEETIESLAQLILGVEGLINPLVLRRTSIESFEVISGHLEYYAAVRAREIDLRKGEMINAFVLDEENETIIKQVNLLRPEKSIPNDTNYSNPDGRLNNLETRLESRFTELQEQQKAIKTQLEQRLQDLESKLPEKIEPLAVFNEWDLDKLSRGLKKGGIYPKQVLNIAQAIIDHRPFESLTDIVDKVKVTQGKRTVRAISEKKMLEIIDNW